MRCKTRWVTRRGPLSRAATCYGRKASSVQWRSVAHTHLECPQCCRIERISRDEVEMRLLACRVKYRDGSEPRHGDNPFFTCAASCISITRLPCQLTARCYRLVRPGGTSLEGQASYGRMSILVMCCACFAPYDAFQDAGSAYSGHKFQEPTRCWGCVRATGMDSCRRRNIYQLVRLWYAFIG